MSLRPEDYWYFEGEAYDLRNFAKVHPGGEDQLMTLQGRECTEMVYSMHAMVSIEKVKEVMAKYKIGAKKKDDPLFKWREDGLYGTLKAKLKKHFDVQNNPSSYKADVKFWIIYAVIVIVQAYLIYSWVINKNYLAPFVTGLLTTAVGFMLFHTAGHCGISKNPKVNTFWYELYANYIFGFVAKIWDLHHNYAHHSYTNIYRKDPDVSNQAAFVRKTEAQAYKPIYKMQWYLAYIVLVFLPNQWWGQVIQYFLAIKKRKIFGLPMIHKRELDLRPYYVYFTIVTLCAIVISYFQGFLFAFISLYLYSSGVGMSYWACVFPNHDTELSEQSSLSDKLSEDWGEHQIRHSSNFIVPGWLSYLIGGMNYQIEHHLFPTIHPRHYPEVSKYVQEECAKRGIPYHRHSSWLDALVGNYKHMKYMSKKNE